MRILAIETSCDETAITILEASGPAESPVFNVLANALHSQIDIHAEYGGVFPTLAKREHMRNLPILFETAVKKVGARTNNHIPTNETTRTLERNEEMLNLAEKHVFPYKNPDIDTIAVTSGPGLEPALWVGIAFAQALGLHWNIPVIPVNHMKGHLFSVLLNAEKQIEWPTLAFLVSGGHTELVYATDWYNPRIIGQTRDDAAGEAFDKVARIIGLPYPGGPHISRLAERSRSSGRPDIFNFPRPMATSDDFDFSFSGLKTAVMYALKNHPPLSDTEKEDVARSFEDAVIDVCNKEVTKALDTYTSKTLILAGGVAANTLLRNTLSDTAESKGVSFFTPETHLATDNATMIGIAGYLSHLENPDLIKKNPLDISAEGNLSL